MSFARSPFVLLVLALAVLLAGCSSSTKENTPTATVAVAKPAYTPRVAPPTGEVSLPTGVSSLMVVGNTGGDGVWLRRTPAMADRLRTWPDNTPMQVVGEDKQAEERTWKNVEDPAGNVGWIPAEYLVRPVPTATARSAATAQAMASEAACLRPSRAFAEHLADGLNFGGGGIAGTQAVKVGPGATPDETWYLIAATVLGSSRGKSVTALWATTIDPTGNTTSGTLVAANDLARDLSVWPLPAQGLDRFPPGDPDVRRAERCLDVALDR